MERTSATPAALARGGCGDLALRLASTVAPGGRSLSELPGPRTRSPGSLWIDLPAGHHVTGEARHDASL